MTPTRRRRRANAGSAHAVAANGCAPRQVPMAELACMEHDIHGSRIVVMVDRDMLLLGCQVVAYSMRAAS